MSDTFYKHVNCCKEVEKLQQVFFRVNGVFHLLFETQQLGRNTHKVREQITFILGKRLWAKIPADLCELG